MKQILNFTNDAWQEQTVLLPDTTGVTFSVLFVPLQQSWFIPSLVYLDFTLTNIRLCNSPNLLYQFKNQIPFGLGVFSVGGREPSLINDLVSGSTKLYLLNEADVQAYKDFLSDKG